MKNYAVIEDGNFVGFINDELYPKIPENAVEITDDVYQDYLANQTHRAWDNDNKTFKHIIPPEPETIFQKLAAQQFWKAANQIGITIDGIKKGVSDTTSDYYISDEANRNDILIDIDKAPYFDRDNPVIIMLAKANGIPEEQIDSLWHWAESLI